MKRFFMNALGATNGLPQPSLVFLTLTAVALLGVPTSHLITSSGAQSFGILIHEFAIVAGLPLIVIVWKKLDPSRFLQLGKPPWKLIGWVIVLTIGADIIIDYLTAASELILPLPETYKLALEKIMSAPTIPVYIWKLFLICVVPGVCEEILFRGFCQTSLAVHVGKTPAILITAFFFALLHGNPWYFHLYFLLGLLLSWVYAVSGTLIVPMMVHILNNAWTFTSHVMDVHIPLNGFSDPRDIFILCCGGVLLFTSGRVIHEKNR